MFVPYLYVESNMAYIAPVAISSNAFLVSYHFAKLLQLSVVFSINDFLGMDK